MNRREMLQGMSLAAVAALVGTEEVLAQGSSGGPVYELRIYHAMEGKRDTLVARFRDHTDALFKKHGLKPVAYWNPTDEPVKGSTFIYILKHPSREAATANWKSFHDDPEWVKVSTASEKNGKLVEKVDSTYMTLTDFSPVV
jgi:NIPSNAP